jgi:transcriptional regulator with XRE-family HTH domain
MAAERFPLDARKLRQLRGIQQVADTKAGKLRPMTQADLAALLHVDVDTISNWERGVTQPDWAMAGALAEELKTTLSELKREDMPATELTCRPSSAASPHHAVDQHNDRFEDRTQRQILGTAPPRPDVFVGRGVSLCELKSMIDRSRSRKGGRRSSVITALRGLPGVGKTATACILAHDSELRTWFGDGILWLTVGPEPVILSLFAQVGRAIRYEPLMAVTSIGEAQRELRAALRRKEFLLVLDDVWHAAHAQLFNDIDGASAILVVTRQPRIADQITTHDESVYVLPPMSEEESLELLHELAPEAVSADPSAATRLVARVEGLPLALQIVGRMLRAETRYGWGLERILQEIDRTAGLLDREVPSDYGRSSTGTPCTLRAVLHQSTDVLSADDRRFFAILGACGPRPASFDIPMIQDICGDVDAWHLARSLAERGLIEPIGSGRFQMHAVVADHAEEIAASIPE